MGPYGWQDLVAWLAGAAALVYVINRFRRRRPHPRNKSQPRNKPDVPLDRLVR